MSLTDFYYNSLAENEKNIRFWEDYIKELKALDFSIFSDRLTVPALVPVGSRMFFRGELRHTSEVTVALGADYFAKCSLNQAEILRQHRLKDAQSKLDTFKNERLYLKNQVSFKTSNVNQNQEIIEYYTEDEDRAWREKHRENVRQHKKKSSVEKTDAKTEITDDVLWNRLDELELFEELENEAHNRKIAELGTQNSSSKTTNNANTNSAIDNCTETEVAQTKVTKSDGYTIPLEDTSKLDMLRQVLDKQCNLEEKLQQMKDQKICHCKTEREFISRLNDIDQLEEVEDEMNRLYDMIQSEDSDSEDEERPGNIETTIKKLNVTFAEDEDVATLELTFKHSKVEPCYEPYDPKKGIMKPSDIYEAFSSSFKKQTTSILKKKTNVIPDIKDANKSEKAISTEEFISVDNLEDATETPKSTILIDDIFEREDKKVIKTQSIARPVSVFKKRRQQMKFSN